MAETLVIPLAPMGKPRMTQRDKWAKRKSVVAYFAYANAILDFAKASHFTLPDYGLSLKFFFPMSQSWSDRRKREMLGEPHQQKPDLDNCVKAILDPLLGEDCTVWQLTAEKRWAETGRIELTITPIQKEKSLAQTHST